MQRELEITETPPENGHYWIETKNEQLEDNKIKEFLHEFSFKVIAKDASHVQLQNRVTGLETRVLETENYSSNDCLIIETMLEVDGNLPLATTVCAISYIILNSNDETNFKACLYLSAPKAEKTITICVFSRKTGNLSI